MFLFYTQGFSIPRLKGSVMAKQLRVATEDDLRLRLLAVDEAALTGDPLLLAYAMRARIAVAVADSKCPPRDLAALTKRLADIAKEIAALEAGKNGDEVGDAAAIEDAPFDATAI